MKNTIKLAVAAALALGTTSAFATNGDNLIGVGAKARGMGAVGIGMNHGAESGLSNPAFIKDNEVTFGGTVFMPNVGFKNKSVTPDPTNGGATMMTSGTKSMDSASDLSVIPEVALSVKVNDNFSWGIGMYGVAGMGVDYRDDVAVYSNGPGTYPSTTGGQNGYMGTQSGTNQMFTNLQLMRFAVPLAYHMDNFSVALSPILQYGSLGIAYNNGAYFNAPQTNPNTGAVTFTPSNVMTGNGVSQDFGMGYNIGLAYEISGLTLGMVYTSAIDMEYDKQISSASKNFGMNRGAGLSDHLEQPSEIGLGASYKMEEHTFAIDYKKINWSSAKGYEDFKWEDQNVIALGYEYAAKGWAIRVGYNYASNPIKEQTAANMQTDYDGAVINYFNAAGFPATTESHYTLGGTYNISDTFGVDMAYTYAPLVTETYNTSAMTQAQVYAATQANGGTVAQAQAAAGASSSEARVTHSQSALTVAMTIKF
jgi:long-chain fatty acid transport protein